MGYKYTLSFTAFKAVDNEACLAEISAVEPDIADGMFVRDDHIIFEPEDVYAKWCSAEDKVIDVIAKHIQPGTTCRVDWQGEDDDMGGTLVGLNKTFQIVYEAYAVTETGNIPLRQAEAMLAAGIHYSSTWDYHTHGEQQYFRKEDWRQDVTNGDTILGYQEWATQNLEHLLHDVDLDGVDAIEVAGCTETDGHVDVVAEGEEAAEFFSVYTHILNWGIECVCDFNTKEQAVSFAKALAARESLPVYGNCCNVEGV